MILVVPVESFLTKFTNVWPGVAVYRLVLAQSRQLPESFAASLAFKVSLVGVRWQMPHQRVLMPELLRTWIECQNFEPIFSRVSFFFYLLKINESCIFFFFSNFENVGSVSPALFQFLKFIVNCWKFSKCKRITNKFRIPRFSTSFHLASNISRNEVSILDHLYRSVEWKTMKVLRQLDASTP